MKSQQVLGVLLRMLGFHPSLLDYH